MRVMGYIRVSTEDQAAHGVSLAGQRSRLQAYVDEREWEMVRVYRDEGLSAKSMRRPALQEALAACERGEAEVLIVAKLDRLTRSVADMDRLIKRLAKGKIALVSLTESLDATTANGQLMIHLLSSVAEWERAMVGERTREALAELKRQGKRYGRGTFGECPQDAATYTRMVELRTAGLTYAQVAEALTAEGRPTRRGGAWSAAVVWRLIERGGAITKKPGRVAESA